MLSGQNKSLCKSKPEQYEHADPMAYNENASLSSDSYFPPNQQETTISMPTTAKSPILLKQRQFRLSSSQDDEYSEREAKIFEKKRKSDYAGYKDQKTEALKMFLLSMMPDLQKMTDEEIRLFKRKTIETVDNIFLSRKAPKTADNVPQASSCQADITNTTPKPSTSASSSSVKLKKEYVDYDD